MLKTSAKFLQPILDRNDRIKYLTPEEKVERIKQKYGLSHGKGKRKKSYKKK